MRVPALRLLLLSAMLAASSLSCGRELTGPDARGRRSGPLSFLPEFPAALRSSGRDIAQVVAFERVRVLFRRSDGVVALDKSFDFPPDADSLPVSLTVPISAGAPETGEMLALSLFYVDAANDTVFTGGPTSVNVVPSSPGDPPPPPIGVTLRYTGPGEEAVRVVLSPATASIVAGQTQAFTTQAFDQFNTAVTAPVLWESSDTSVVTVSDAGVATARTRRASAFVIAKLYSGQADTSSVGVTLPASRMEATSGGGQSGAVGTMLAQSVVVRVTAADSVPVAGVAVSFAATGGGTPGSPVVSTDASGYASTSWTLGNAVGTQTMTATAAGLAGSPVAFTATATPGVPTSLAFTTQPVTVVAGQAMAPAVVVEARTAGGQLATGFTDSVTITIANNPGGATMLGTATVAAVNGIATFANLAFDRAAIGYTLTASAAPLTSATSGAFTVTAAAAVALEFSVQPAGGTPATPLNPSPVVRAIDSFDNPATFAGTVSIALGANPGGSTLGGTTSRAAVAGVATFDDLTLSGTGSGYTLVASATGLTSATSDAFNIGAQTISWVNVAGGNWSDPANWNLNRVPNASDVVEISLNGTYTVTLDVNPNVAGIQLGMSASGAQTLQGVSRTLTVAGDLALGVNGRLTLISSLLNGTGSLVNQGAVLLYSGTVATTMDNRALVHVTASSSLTGAVLNAPGAIIRVAQADGCCGTATLTVSNGFTNDGIIELSNQFTSPFGAALSVTNGTLVNAVGGEIWALGGQTPGGARTLAAQLDNQGTVFLRVPLQLSRPNSAHQNSGLIDLDAHVLTISQSGAPASFTNTGTMSMGAGASTTINGGTLNVAAGSIGGTGQVVLNSVTANFAVPVSNANTSYFVSGSTINGPGTFTNATGRTLVLYSSTVNAPFVNDGLLASSGSSTIGGTFANPAGATVRIAQLDGCCGTATLTFANGFTNEGLIELSNQFNQPYGAQLTVATGTLVNAPGATIASLGGQTPGGARTLAAQLDNQGTVTLGVPLTLSRPNSAHLNSGTIDATMADLTLAQSGAPASFTNTGSVVLATGRTLFVSGGSLVQAAGTLGGAGTLTLQSLTAAFSTPISNATMAINVIGSTINGPAQLTNAAGQSLVLWSSTVNAPMVNDGLLISSGSSTINGTFVQSPGATVRVAQLDGCCGTATLTYAAGFSNNGTIELSNQFNQPYGAQLTVVNGTLVNAPSATIAAIGGQTPGGQRTLAVQLDNQGTLLVTEPLTISRPNSAHLNSGVIDATAASLTINQSGAPASFTNTGTLTIGAGRTLTVTGGSFFQSAGTFGGPGTVSLTSMAITFTTPFSNATTALNIAGATINGTGTVTNAAGRTLTLFSSTVNAPLVNDGLLLSSGSSVIGGSFTNNPGATVRVGQLDGCCGTATLTVTNGFTNQGAIELSNQFNQPYGADLNVPNGTLVNAPSATIAALGGQTPGGGRGLNAQLDNQGTVTAAVPMSMNRPNSAHVNSGLIDLVGGGLSISQSGGPASFTNTGSIGIGAGRTFSITGGSFSTGAGASVTGAGALALTSVTSSFTDATPAVSSIALSGGAATFAQATGTASTAWVLAGTTLNSAAAFTHAAGQTLTMYGTIANAPFVNEGTLISSGSSSLNGAFSNAPSGILRVQQVDGCCGTAVLTIASGFTNQGVIELSNQFNQPYGAQLNVTAGFLVNATGATLASLGGQTPGGARVLSAALNNQGTVVVATPLQINAPSADHVSSGLIDATAANLVITQSGTTPTFTNAGSITLATGRIVQVTGGVFIGDVTGTITGAGNFLLTNAIGNMNGAAPAVDGFSVNNSTVSIAQAYNTASSALALVNSTLNGAGSLTNASTRTLLLDAATIQVPVTNEGTMHVSGNTQIVGAMTTTAASYIRIGQINNAASLASMTFANAWTNNGTVELTTAFATAFSARLAVTTGQFVNGATGTILTSDGLAAGGTRELVAPGGVNNQGTLRIGAGTAGRLTVTAPFQSSGTLDLEVGGATIATQYDHLQIVGSATLTGTLRLTLINGFVPGVGQAFTPITYSSGGGTFSGIDFPPNFVDPPAVSGTAVTVTGTTP